MERYQTHVFDTVPFTAFQTLFWAISSLLWRVAYCTYIQTETPPLWITVRQPITDPLKTLILFVMLFGWFTICLSTLRCIVQLWTGCGRVKVRCPDCTVWFHMNLVPLYPLPHLVDLKTMDRFSTHLSHLSDPTRSTHIR
jgi:hypothetical protein